MGLKGFRKYAPPDSTTRTNELGNEACTFCSLLRFSTEYSTPPLALVHQQATAYSLQYRHLRWYLVQARELHIGKPKQWQLFFSGASRWWVDLLAVLDPTRHRPATCTWHVHCTVSSTIMYRRSTMLSMECTKSIWTGSQKTPDRVPPRTDWAQWLCTCTACHQQRRKWPCSGWFGGWWLTAHYTVASRYLMEMVMWSMVWCEGRCEVTYTHTVSEKSEF